MRFKILGLVTDSPHHSLAICEIVERVSFLFNWLTSLGGLTVSTPRLLSCSVVVRFSDPAVCKQWRVDVRQIDSRQWYQVTGRL